ncbi:iron-containing alcohol dehydrogenase [Roseobacter sp. HKCCA0434]|uniref:iron-containing alcohol dehydrogenase n=1 Tax=Roseobacter sp. HKCCA0434 TaxID=3079297 RepID=UPI0029058BA1|nr:iron-containing alcohol dehydrogenase [Roseobacter sp. HKCCA0434]
MVTEFGFTAPEATLFGRGARDVAAERIAGLGRRVLMVRGRSVEWVEALERQIDGELVRVVATGEPDLDAVRAGVAVAREAGCDVVVAVGGGAVIDLGKAIAGVAPGGFDIADHVWLDGQAVPLADPLPFVAIPTTAGTGAEVTRNAVIGVPERQAKISLRDVRLVPRLALVDPALTDGSPKGLTLSSGLDAVTQLIESYISARETPVTQAICAGAIPEALAALIRLMDGEAADARDAMARASHLSGLALANSGLGVVHGFASVLGARGGAHGAICGRLLAAGLAVNGEALARRGKETARIEQVRGWLGEAFGAGDGIAALQGFVDRNGLPTLADLGVTPEDHVQMARQTAGASSTQANPVVLEDAELQDVLRRAG